MAKLPTVVPPSNVDAPAPGTPRKGGVELPSDTSLQREIRKCFLVGTMAITVFFGGLAVWGAVAPLAEGAAASGRVSVESNRKTIQHLEGGIVREIHVRAGDTVEPGDPLITLDDTAPLARSEQLRKQVTILKIRIAKLVAQRDGMTEIVYPDDILVTLDDPEIAEIAISNEQAFQSETDVLSGRIAVLREQINQANSAIRGSEAEIESLETQLALIQEEIDGVSGLLDRGLAQKPRLLSLQREQAAIDGRIHSARSEIASTRERIGELELQILNRQTEAREQTLSDLRAAQEELANALEEQRAVADVLNRTVITSPDRGTIVVVHLTTIGGVVQPAQPLVDIVPHDDPLIVDVQVKRTDIDIVHAGMPAIVTFSSFSIREMPVVHGTVVHVSADTIENADGGEFYQALIRVDPMAIDEQHRDLVQPGMPASVNMVTGHRSPLIFFIEPLYDLARQAFIY